MPLEENSDRFVPADRLPVVPYFLPARSAFAAMSARELNGFILEGWNDSIPPERFIYREDFGQNFFVSGDYFKKAVLNIANELGGWDAVIPLNVWHVVEWTRFRGGGFSSRKTWPDDSELPGIVPIYRRRSRDRLERDGADFTDSGQARGSEVEYIIDRDGGPYGWVFHSKGIYQNIIHTEPPEFICKGPGQHPNPDFDSGQCRKCPHPL